jgi:hypothetical protein
MASKKRRSSKATPARSTPSLQKMGGKEERVSEVGSARARVERKEAQGAPRFDDAPGPSSDRLLQDSKGRRTAKPNQRVSRKSRAGPAELEAEDKSTTKRKSGALDAKLDRQPIEQVPPDPGEPPGPGEAPE